MQQDRVMLADKILGNVTQQRNGIVDEGYDAIDIQFIDDIG
jgi:hypothetical protein